MKSFLPIFSAALICGLCKVLGGQELAPPAPERPAAAAPSPPAGEYVPEGDRLIRVAVERLAQHQSIAAKVRQRLDLFGQQLLGSGTYLQQGTGSAARLRLELRIQGSDQEFSLLNVCDGRYLWTFKQLGKEVSLGRVELSRVASARERSAQSLPPNVFAQGPNIGGLSRLLEDVGKCFQFSTVQEGSLDNQPVLAVEGRWRPQALAALLPESGEAEDDAPREPNVKVDDLPSHVPDAVVVLLGKDDLLPYRIEFSRRQRSGGSRSIVAIDFFDIEINALVNPQEFVYLPGKRQWTDQTEAYIKRLGLQRE